MANLTYIHKFLRGKRNTTLLLLHGTGGDEEDMLPLGNAISPESSLLSPRGKVSENGMPRFFKRIREGVFDQEDLKFRSLELSNFVKEAAATYNFNIDSVIVVGYSNGANIATSILLLGYFRFAGAILFRPMTPLIPSKLPNLKGVQVYIAAGKLDQSVPRIDTERLVAMIQSTNAKVTLKWEADGHAISGEEIQDAKNWFDSKLLR